MNTCRDLSTTKCSSKVVDDSSKRLEGLGTAEILKERFRPFNEYRLGGMVLDGDIGVV